MAHVSFEGVCCSDCVQPVAHGDFTSLDYYYSDEEADTKAFVIECGMQELCEEHEGSLHIGDLVDESSRARCDVCGSTLAGSRHGILVLSSNKAHHESCAQNIDHALRCTCERERIWEQAHA